MEAVGRPVPSGVVRHIAFGMASLTQVRKDALPPLPTGWSRNERDSKAFYRGLVRLTDERLRATHWEQLGGLLVAFGLTREALLRFAGKAPTLSRRPYVLMHSDLSPDNVLVPWPGEPDAPVRFRGWGSVMYGDPLHGLAGHLERMRYPATQWDEVVETWSTAMEQTRRPAVAGLRKDLAYYVDFERARAAYAEVIRAGAVLSASTVGGRLPAAAASVHASLVAAAYPLHLVNVPTRVEVSQVLHRWHRARLVQDGRMSAATAFGWRPDPRLPERADFSRANVLEALAQEGNAPAERVFIGTVHVNTVVKVSGFPDLVVVRRKASSRRRSEPSFLSEHAVLNAIEDSGVMVEAPRVLALGHGHGGDAFAIQTYMGDRSSGRPCHPVKGLGPYEADHMVDQLAALARVDYRALDPAAGEPRFFEWLTNGLVELVYDLAPETSLLARSMGLPEPSRLREIFARHWVTERSPVLLHGDLNPWNLVVREPWSPSLAIIDWEMAMIGDPLYDLVRHFHLTPTTADIRQRMFRRWSRWLPPEHTRGWQRDWLVYRWIEQARSAYVDLDRLVSAAELEAPNVRRAIDGLTMTLAEAMGALGLPSRRSPGGQVGNSRLTPRGRP
ncbi:phosphotransferase [Streptomyces griseorubiginosus]|uniref:aminoglycoside phosphotransferase family protein n=1 Tax=Streptomyces griseorubiginosus TaxID=67304 RepID=UPI0036E0EA1D